MLSSEIINPYITLLYPWGFKAYKSPAHFMWTTLRFTKKLSVDCHHKGHIVFVRHHYSNSLLVSSCKLGIYGAEQLPVPEVIVDLVLLAALYTAV